MSSAKRVWLVTGGSSGIGRCLTEIILENGEKVATLQRDCSPLQDISDKYSESFLSIKCDVSEPSYIRNAFQLVIERFGSIDVVYNGAGYGIVAEVESTPEEAARKLFDVNFWGAAMVSREAIRVFRECSPIGKGGRLLNVSSGAGVVPSPALGYYSASKHALEGLTEALSKEMDPGWNIKISIIEPGAFKTKAHNTYSVIFPPAPPYNNPALASNAIRGWFESGTPGITGNPAAAARKIFEFASLPSPPLRLQLGKDCVDGVRNRMQSFLEEMKEYESWSENVAF